MKKIITLNLNSLINAKHFNFMDFTSTAIENHTVISSRFGDAVATFRTAFDRENDVYMKYDRKILTARINSAEVMRDTRFRVLRDAVKTSQLMPSPEIQTAGEELMGVIDLYGGAKIPGMAMDAETGVLTNLVEDLEQKYAAQVEVLNVGGLVTDLKLANGTFKELLRARTEADSKVGKAAMVEARRGTDVAWRVLMSSVNNAFFLGEDAALVPFMDFMNAEIERYRISLGQGAGNPELGEDSEGSDGGSGAEDSGGTDEGTTPPPTTEPDNGDSGSGSGSTGGGPAIGEPTTPGPGGDDPDL